MDTKAVAKDLHIGKPGWLKTKIPAGETYYKIKRDLRAKNLATVCEEARCPNIAECWGQNTATFMILGDTCTRACRFCHVKTGNPQQWLDPDEPEKTADSVALMKLKYAVITMVDRDDLEDGGAHHVSLVIKAVRQKNPGIIQEILTGDFAGRPSSLQKVMEAQPEVFAHNVETVKRLSKRVRDSRASYEQSLEVLHYVKSQAKYPVLTKSALMLGLGETDDEIIEALKDLRQAKVDLITLGQYMRPTKKHLSIKRFVSPEKFKEFEHCAYELGFLGVASGPLVRSSYRAYDFYLQAMKSAPKNRRLLE